MRSTYGSGGGGGCDYVAFVGEFDGGTATMMVVMVLLLVKTMGSKGDITGVMMVMVHILVAVVVVVPQLAVTVVAWLKWWV